MLLLTLLLGAVPYAVLYITHTALIQLLASNTVVP
jgi:hypothetical protein